MSYSTTTQIIAKEGWKYVTFTFLLWLFFMWIDFFEWVFFFLFVLTLYMFRNPERIPDEDDALAILAPSDGKIASIGKDENGYLKVSIEKSIFDVSLLRSPCGLSIEKTTKIHGLFLPSSDLLSNFLNERIFLTCKRRENVFHINIIAGLFSRKIDLFKTIGSLKVSQRCGLLVDGRVDILLPKDVRIKVALGDKVNAGQSILGYFSYDKVNDAS